MKKVLIALCIASLLLCAACGVSGGGQAEPSADTVTEPAQMPASAQAWLSFLREKLPFDDQMSETDQGAAIYGILEEDGYTGDSAMLISTMATPEEIAVFKADDVYSAARLTELAEARIAQQKESYASYAPLEMPKLDSAVIRTCGEYVIVCVCADNVLASQIMDAIG